MPVVTVDETQFERRELKSAPPDGYVMVRPLPYGLKLIRRDKMSKMKMQSDPTRGRNAPAEIELSQLQEWAVAHDCAYCIGEHNLQDADGSLLNFKNPETLKKLNPKVGSEIERILDSINEEDDEEALADFMKLHGSSSDNGQNTSSTDSIVTSSTVMETSSIEGS